MEVWLVKEKVFEIWCKDDLCIFIGVDDEGFCKELNNVVFEVDMIGLIME